MTTEDFMEQGCYGCGCAHTCQAPDPCHHYCPPHLADLDQLAAETTTQWAAQWN